MAEGSTEEQALVPGLDDSFGPTLSLSLPILRKRNVWLDATIRRSWHKRSISTRAKNLGAFGAGLPNGFSKPLAISIGMSDSPKPRS
jgi:hypothetical protein